MGDELYNSRGPQAQPELVFLMGSALNNVSQPRPLQSPSSAAASSRTRAAGAVSPSECRACRDLTGSSPGAHRAFAAKGSAMCKGQCPPAAVLVGICLLGATNPHAAQQEWQQILPSQISPFKKQ